MAIFFSRTIVIPAWIAVFVFVVLFVTPWEAAAKALALVGLGLVVMAILLRRSATPGSSANELCPIDVPPVRVTRVPRQSRRQRWTSR